MMMYFKIKCIVLLLIQYNISSACPDGMKLFLDSEGLPECFSCRNCPWGSNKVANCTYKHDTICDECTDEEYYDDRSLHCKTCTVCDAGYYVKRNCSTFKNTQCDVCPRGTFSLFADSSRCTKCNDCRGANIIQVCNRTADTVCEQIDEENDEEKQRVGLETDAFKYLFVVAILVSVIALGFCGEHARRRHRKRRTNEKRREKSNFGDHQPLMNLPYSQETHRKDDSSLQDTAQIHGITESTDNCFQEFKKYLKDIYRKMICCYTDVVYGKPYAEFNMTSKTPRRPHPMKVKHVFYENGQVFKRICVIGEASIGKTTLCRSIVNDYCSSNAQLKDLLCYGQDFEWLFYISLRHFRRWSNVYDMIEYGYFQNHEHLFSQILETGERVLVILDGFDEWKIPRTCDEGNNVLLDLSNFDDLQNCTVLITTRPTALTKSMSSGILPECDIEITINFITRTSANRLKREVVDEWNMGENKEIVEPYIEDKRIITHPLLLKQLVRLYCKDKIPKHPDEPLCNTFGKILLNWLKDVNFIDETDNFCEQVLPECLTTEKQNNILILSLLGKVAFDILIKNDSNNSNLGALRDVGFSQSMIETCLDISLLSLGLDCCSESDDLTLVSFPHVLYLDYFAAMYIFENPGSVKTLLEKCNTADKIMSFRFLFIFLSGMNSSAMEIVFDRIKGILDNETTADENLKLSHRSLLNMQSLALACVGEQQQSLVDFNFKNIHICLEAFNENRRVNVNTFLKSLQKCNAVQRAVLELHKRLDENIEGILLETIKMKTDTLTTLNLRGIGCQPYVEYLYCGKVSKLMHLQISDFALSHTCKQFLMTGLGKAVAVQELVLVNITCIDHEQCPCPLELLNCSHLKRLTLKKVQLGWVRVNTASLTDCIETDTPVFYSPSKKIFKSSTELKLKHIKNPSDVDAFADLLSSLPRLSHLEVSLSDFGSKEVLLPKTAVSLKKIVMVRVNMTNVSLIRFINSIPRGKHEITCEFDEITALSSEKGISKIVELTSYEVCVPCGINFKFKIKPKLVKIFI